MAVIAADGITTRYESLGEGPALLMFAPGGFDAVIERWSTAATWKAINAMVRLPATFRVVVYDRREAGQSGGRLETLTWERYARQAHDLIRGLGIDKAYLLGACMGCSIALAFAANYPSVCEGLILHWPVGGYRWNLMGRERFDKAEQFARNSGMVAVAERAQRSKSFWADPESGPWSAPSGTDMEFAQRLAATDLEQYIAYVATSRESLFPSEFPTGAHPAEVRAISTPTLIVPGGDEVHTRSAAYGLHELLRNAEIWDVPPSAQSPTELHRRIVNAARGGNTVKVRGGMRG